MFSIITKVPREHVKNTKNRSFIGVDLQYSGVFVVSGLLQVTGGNESGQPQGALKKTTASSPSTTTIAPYACQPPLYPLRTQLASERQIRQAEREQKSDRWAPEQYDVILCLYKILERKTMFPKFVYLIGSGIVWVLGPWRNIFPVKIHFIWEKKITRGEMLHWSFKVFGLSCFYYMTDYLK